MTAVTAPTSAPATTGVTQARVLRSESTKLRSLRSTRWSLLAAVVAMAGLGPLVAAVQMARWAHLEAHEKLGYDAINTGVGGYHMAQLAIGVLGVLVISGEYATGMIRSSLMAVPRRLPVLWAKAAVFAAVTFVLMLVATLVSFVAVQAIVTQHGLQRSLGPSARGTASTRRSRRSRRASGRCSSQSPAGSPTRRTPASWCSPKQR